MRGKRAKQLRRIARQEARKTGYNVDDVYKASKVEYRKFKQGK